MCYIRYNYSYNDNGDMKYYYFSFFMCLSPRAIYSFWPKIILSNHTSFVPIWPIISKSKNCDVIKTNRREGSLLYIRIISIWLPSISYIFFQCFWIWTIGLRNAIPVGFYWIWKLVRKKIASHSIWWEYYFISGI